MKIKLKYRFFPTKKPGTTIKIGMIGPLAIALAFLVDDGKMFAFGLFLIETFYLSYKATKERNK